VLLKLCKQLVGARTKLPLQHLVDVLKGLRVDLVLQHLQRPAEYRQLAMSGVSGIRQYWQPGMAEVTPLMLITSGRAPAPMGWLWQTELP
jgi:hypothetical protein